MPENSFGDFFLSDSDDEITVIEGDLEQSPEPVPLPASAAAMSPAVPAPTQTGPSEPAAVSTPEPPMAAPAPAPAPAEPTPVVPAELPQAPTAGETREKRLADALNRLMDESPDIQAAALVSLDGFTMASALPDGMQEDRVGAMSAAILGLGERAAAELGRGELSQVFIEGEGGYVVLMAAGTRSVLTCLADESAKLGLLLYDMRGAAAAVGEILG